MGGDYQSIPSYGGSQASPSLLVALQVWLVDYCQQMASLLVDLCNQETPHCYQTPHTFNCELFEEASTPRLVWSHLVTT